MNTLSSTLVALLAAGVPMSLRAQDHAAPAGAPKTAAHTPPAAAQAALERAKQAMHAHDTKAAQAAVEEAIEADPDCIAAHELLREVHFQRARGTSRPSPEQAKAAADALVAQYEAWAKRFPRSSGVQYGLGALFSAREDPRARPYLLEAVKLDPTLAKAYQMLSIDAERWGDMQASRDFMHRATLADPSSPDYAFYYASSLQNVDRGQWVAASLEVAKRFPTSDRGAQALYWLGERSSADGERIAFWEQARTTFPPQRFSWSRSSMTELFDAYLRTAPDKALALAQDMNATAGEQGDAWSQHAALATDYIEARKLIAAGSFADAGPVVDRLKIDRRSSNAGMLALLKAEVTAGKGDVQGAYDALVERFAATPEDRLHTALLGYGTTLGKTAEQVEGDVRARRDAAAKPAPALALRKYGVDATARLEDYRGKVVLLTFWFPGCGPCRGEFPHLENVLAKFQGRGVAYLGINTVPEQDDYVLSFMAGTKYSFTPLHGDDQVAKAYAVRGCPTNFLIDQTGKIVYHGFMIHGDNEILLQRMIESLLAHAPPAKD